MSHSLGYQWYYMAFNTNITVIFNIYSGNVWQTLCPNIFDCLNKQTEERLNETTQLCSSAHIQWEGEDMSWIIEMTVKTRKISQI